MKVLLDTNIIIHREARKVLNKDIGLLFQWLDKLKIEKTIHPDSLLELKGHRDHEIVETMLIKAGNYFQLKTLSKDSKEVIKLRAGDSTKNDEIDTNIVKELFNGKVDYLITEDRGIHEKTNKLGVGHLTFTIDAFIEKVTAENPALTSYNVLSVQKKYFGHIDINEEFFDSFKQDYQEFESWFNKKSDNQAYVCNVDNNLGAFLYLKVEHEDEVYSDIAPVFKPKKRLKIGTFKVTSTGYKLGERFLKIIFDNAIINRVDEIYVTLFDKTDEQGRLIALLEDWGFYKWGVKTTANGAEVVMVRDFLPSFDNRRCQLTYPYVKCIGSIFIVPIYPSYHTELFPDSILTNESPKDFVENEPHRNAIRKTYISRSINRSISPGDVLVFYRTKDGGPASYTSVVTTIAIVESVHNNIPNEDEFIKLCRKRSIFDDNELRRHWKYKGRGQWVSPFIVNFLYVCTLPAPRLNLSQLISLGVIDDIDSAPRGFEPITKEKFEAIISNSRVNESYFIN